MIDKLVPRLVVDDAAAAIDFYGKAFGAVEVERTAHNGTIVHAELSFDGVPVMVKDADEFDPAPGTLGGTPVLLTVDTVDVDALGQRLEAAGATVVFPISDQDYGRRDGRFRDPFGHLWIVGRHL